MDKKLRGLFSSFDNLDQINVELLSSWLKPSPPISALENYIGNKILYPQAISLTAEDIKIDLGILREAIKLNNPKIPLPKTNALMGDNPFLNMNLRKILIPAEFLNYLPNLSALAWVFVDGLLIDRKKKDWFEDLWTVVLTGEVDEVVGSVILPQFQDKNEVMEITVLDKDYKVKAGSLVVIPCSKDRCEISYKLPKGKILGKQLNAVEVYGGKLGLMIDGRKM